MTCRKLLTKRFLIGTALGAMLSVATITGCASDTGPEDSRDSDRDTVSTVTTERETDESGGEHSNGREGNESGGESGKGNGENGSGGEGSSESSDGGAVSQINTEREADESGGEHSNGSEGNESADENGGGREGNESGGEGGKGNGEHGSGGEGSSESSDGSAETNEADMSSPITPLGQPWQGVLGGLAVSMQYDAATLSVHGTVRNTLSQRLCYVQAEPHLELGTTTVGELGPDQLGHLDPGQEARTSLTVASEPELAGVSYDGYVVHMETFDCGGPGPAAHMGGEGTEGSGEHGSEGEEGNESTGADGEEGSGANSLAPDETFDEVRSGARLILKFDASSNSFKGTVENTTNGVLYRVRIEAHLSNGWELGPTTPTDMAPGEVVAINLPATQASFTTWTAHAEVGSAEERSESGGEQRNGGEHGSGEESGGEHDGEGERRGGG